MLRMAQRSVPGVPLARADLDDELPLQREVFDAFLCTLVSEHLTRLHTLFSEAFAVLRGGGRMVFSAFHPELAAAGIEANFERHGTEYRLGAERHTVDDYLSHIHDAGFRNVHWREYSITAELLAELPSASKYLEQPLLLLIDASRPRASTA
jgi:SAM-dependent methyltransferase